MKNHAANQRGVTLIVLLVALAIISIIGFFVLQRTGMLGSSGGRGSTRDKAIGMKCRTVISSLGTATRVKQTMNQEVESLDALAEEQPSLRSGLTSNALWAEDGYPYLEYVSETEYIITGYCVDGLMYEYDSSSGTVSDEPWE